MNPWECPRCHVIHAGWVARCDCKPNTAASTGEGVSDPTIGAHRSTQCPICHQDVWVGYSHECTPKVIVTVHRC